MKTLTIGYSPCPNDTFIFYAMIHQKIDAHNLKFNEILLDVETLNHKALVAELDITKISYAAFGHIRNSYTLLKSGGALGRGCGPLVVAKKDCRMENLPGKTIAIPGTMTTAYLLLQLFDERVTSAQIRPMPFNQIISCVARNEVDAGLIIHESRFTYQEHGLRKIVDLGQWWEEETGLPIPLGAIVGKRSLGKDRIREIDIALQQSVAYALANRSEPIHYIKIHSEELSDDVISKHIDLYVNDFTLNIGDDGEKAVTELLLRAENAGIIPKSNHKYLFS